MILYRNPATSSTVAGLFIATLALCPAVILPGLFTGCSAGRVNVPAPKMLLWKSAAPQPFAKGAPRDVFERQFRLDTGRKDSTPRAEFNQSLRIRAQSRDRLQLHFDLSAWPEPLQPSARLWVCVGAANDFTTEVNVNLSFSQNGAGVFLPLNNSTAIDGVALMGCDFAARDGDVTIEIENQGMPRDVDCTLRAILYVPETSEAR